MKDNFEDTMKYRNPVVPFFGENIGEDYTNDQYVNVLCDLLKENAPELLSRFKYIVIESAKRSEAEKTELVDMEEAKFKLIGDIQAQEDKLDYELTQLPNKPGEGRWQSVLSIVLTAGLSVFMVVGVANLFSVSPGDIFRPDNLFVLMISIFAAASINLGERKTIESHTKYIFDVERYYADLEASKATGETVGSSRPPANNRRLNPAIYVAGAILVCETAFVSLGFLSTPSFSTAQPIDPVLKNTGIIAASALAGLVNIALAWGDALQKASWERENLRLKKDIVNKHFSSESIFVSKQQLNDLEKRIAKKEKAVELARKLSVEEHIRFSQDLSDYLISIPKHFGVEKSTPTYAYTNGSKINSPPIALNR